MELTEMKCDIKIKRTILKALVFISLLILFYIFYFKQVFDQYSNQLTNTAKFEEKIEHVEPPTLTICFEPIYKPSVLEKYNVTEEMFFEDDFTDLLFLFVNLFFKQDKDFMEISNVLYV